jgi:hypothetical protein
MPRRAKPAKRARVARKPRVAATRSAKPKAAKVAQPVVAAPVEPTQIFPPLAYNQLWEVTPGQPDQSPSYYLLVYRTIGDWVCCVFVTSPAGLKHADYDTYYGQFERSEDGHPAIRLCDSDFNNHALYGTQSHLYRLKRLITDQAYPGLPELRPGQVWQNREQAFKSRILPPDTEGRDLTIMIEALHATYTRQDYLTLSGDFDATYGASIPERGCYPFSEGDPPSERDLVKLLYCPSWNEI